MSSGMPFHLEKGYAFSAFDKMSLKASRQVLLDTLMGLVDGKPIDKVGPFAVLDGSPKRPPFPIGDHLNADWFGKVKVDAVWNPDPPGRAYTGWWVGYKGDVEGIVRETMIRALLLSLDLARPAPGSPPNLSLVRSTPWPISYLVKCSQAWFEGWITWNAEPGVVQVIFCTPADTGVDLPHLGISHGASTVLSDPLSSWTPFGSVNSKPVGTLQAPGIASKDPDRAGMLVVTQQHQATRYLDGGVVTIDPKPDLSPRTQGAPKGEIAKGVLHGLVWQAQSNVVCVKPDPAAGGAPPLMMDWT